MAARNFDVPPFFITRALSLASVSLSSCNIFLFVRDPGVVSSVTFDTLVSFFSACLESLSLSLSVHIWSMSEINAPLHCYGCIKKTAHRMDEGSVVQVSPQFSFLASALRSGIFFSSRFYLSFATPTALSVFFFKLWKKKQRHVRPAPDQTSPPPFCRGRSALHSTKLCAARSRPHTFSSCDCDQRASDPGTPYACIFAFD